MTFKNDYDGKGFVKLNKEIFDVLLITEKSTIALNNADINQLYFIEDIFKFCLIGTMTFNDRYNLMEYGPFTGNEKIAIFMLLMIKEVVNFYLIYGKLVVFNKSVLV
jgi:hypothetical protein